MLCIAVPKSASTALVATLEKTYGIPDETKVLRKQVIAGTPAKEYTSIAVTHPRDFFEVTASLQDFFRENEMERLYKYHFPPTENNQNVLRYTKKVILLRDPKDIILAYKRGDESGAFKIKDPAFAFCFTKKGWLQTAENIGVLKELQDFCEGWEQHSGEKLIIYYDDLIGDFEKTMKRVVDYFGLPPSSITTQLEKKRYSKNNSPKKLFYLKWLKIIWNRRALYKRMLVNNKQ